MDDIIKIVKSLKNSGLLIKSVSETVENEVKEQKGGVLGVLASTLGASSLGNMLRGKEMKSKKTEHEATIPGLRIIWAGEVTIEQVKEQIELVRIFNATSSFRIP